MRSTKRTQEAQRLCFPQNIINSDVFQIIIVMCLGHGWKKMRLDITNPLLFRRDNIYRGDTTGAPRKL